MNKVVIVDYEAGNLRSVANMLTFLNVPFLITSDKDEILNAQRIIFPGQGHFAQAMNNLDKALEILLWCRQKAPSDHIVLQNIGLIYFKLGFSIWNPGIHDKGKYERNIEGWRDVWNFVDFTREAISKTELIKHIRVKLEDGIETGPAKAQGAVADFYPYWFAYLTFTGEYGKSSVHKKYDHLL